MPVATESMVGWSYRGPPTENKKKALVSATVVSLVVDWSYSIVYQPLIYFTDEHVGPASTFSWSFGQSGATSTEQNPSHAYVVPAGETLNFTVRLTVDGSPFKERVISVTAPVLAAGAVDLSASALTIVEATNMSISQASRMRV